MAAEHADIQSEPLGFSVTSLDPAFRENPHEMLDRLRETSPVVQDTVLGRVILTRAADVEAVLRDRDLFVDPRKAPEGSFMRMLASRRDDRGGSPSMLFLDPPDHDRLRGLVNKAFTPKAVDRMAPRIQDITDSLLDGLEGRAEFDLIGDFSAPLPTIVIAEMLGIDPGDQARFKAWSDAIVQGFNPFASAEERAQIEQAGNEMNAYLREAVEVRRADRRDDLISAMVEAEEDGEQMTDEEIVTMVGLLLAAGNLTTTDLIGNGVYAFMTNRDQWEKLGDQPELLHNAIEEMLRFDPPVTQSGRLTLKEMEVGGCPVHAGTSISPLLLAANHDPAAHPDPHRFDITREDTQHVSFGGGRRYCLGAPLARLEAQIAIGTLVRRFPNLSLATGTVEHRSVPAFRGLVALPVKPG
ncbi:MAG: cytochrome P450 [Dehalococcoidia bacterium]